MSTDITTWLEDSLCDNGDRKVVTMSETTWNWLVGVLAGSRLPFVCVQSTIPETHQRKIGRANTPVWIQSQLERGIILIELIRVDGTREIVTGRSWVVV